MNIMSVPRRCSSGKYHDFLSIGESSLVIPRNPGSHVPPLVVACKESVLCTRARTNACSRRWYRSFQRGPLNRNGQPERRRYFFLPFNNGRSARADTNRAKIKDALANVVGEHLTSGPRKRTLHRKRLGIHER